MEILKSDGTWAEKQPEQWETVATPNTPAQSYNQLDSKPEELAELYNLSSKLGVSQSAVKNNLDVARKAANIPDFEKLQERAPILVGQTKDAWFLGLAQDDLENLATIEERTAALNKQRQQINEGATKQINKLSSSWVPGFIKGTDTFKELVSGQAMDRAGVLWEQRRNLILQGKDLPPDKLEYLAQLDAASSFETTKTGLSSFIPAAGEFAGQMFSGMTSPQVLERGLEGAIAGGAVGAAASIPTGGLASPVTATSGAVTGAGLGLRTGYFEHAHDVEAGQAFREFRTLKDGEGVQLDDKTAAVAAELVGVVNATLETVGFSAVAKVVPGLRKVMSNGVKGLILSNPTVRKAFFDFIKNYAAAWTGEVTTEMAQELTNIVVGGVLQDESITKTITSPDTLAQLQDIAVKVGKGMAVMGLGGGGVTLAGDIKAAHRAKTEATARKQKFVDFATSAEASRLKERSPEAFGEFMQRVGQKHGVETVLLQADRVVETLVEQQGMAPEEVSAWAQQYGVSQQELATAMQTGGTIELEFGKVAANLGKDETITLFQDDFHLEHGETPINAVADSVQGESQTAVRIKELYEEEQQRLITPDLADQIISDITAQLKDANIKGDNPALSVMPIIARANVLAKLTGTDAAEHLQRFGITIRRQGFDEFAAEHQLDAAQFQVAAWHGSPHDHNKFDSSKIGTGEGAQAYGWGLYFAGKKDVAEFYRDTLSKQSSDPLSVRIRINGKPIGELLADRFRRPWDAKIKVAIDGSGGNLDAAIDSLKTQLENQEHISGPNEATRSKYAEMYSFLEDLKNETVEVVEPESGRLYEVELAPNEDELLLWDKPLSEQSDKVRESIHSIKENYGWDVTDLGEPTGKNIYQWLETVVSYEGLSGERKGGVSEAVSELLHDAGIRGIKYLDGSSRSQGEGDHNYVIFNDEDVSIKAKFSRMDEAGATTEKQIAEAKRLWQEKGVESPYFKKWFGDSKVVDENGKPLVMYHGTGNEIESFDRNRIKLGLGFFFTKKKSVAKGYADRYVGRGKGNVLSVYLNIRNPIRLETEAGRRVNEEIKAVMPADARGDAYKEAFVREAQSRGYDGMTMLDGVEYVAFSPEQIKSATGNRGTFDATDPRISYQADTLFRTDAAPRGALISGEGGNLITLFEQANVSTFLHEMGHLFLNDLKYVADKYGVQVDEWNAIKEWLGVDVEITREQHEQFARGFEAYLREGEAPVAGLRAAFRQFKSWLVKIYRTADALQVDINDDLRRVFDRLVATEEEIQQARELAAQVAILDEKFFSEVGATDAEKEEYRASVNNAEYSATEKKDKQRVGKLDDRLKEFRAQAKEEIKQEPLYKAMDELVEKGGIDKASVTRLFGKINLPNVKGLFKKDGLDIEHAAIEAGDESAREFVDAMTKAKTKQQWIEQRVTQLEIEHDQGLTTEEAIRTAQSRKQMELESKWLARKEAAGRAALARKALRIWADQTTDAQKVGDAIRVSKLLTTSRNLRQQVIKAAKAGDWTKAFDLNEKARMNEALIAAHYRVNEDFRKMQTRWKRAVKADVAYEYRQQINQLMLKHQMVSRRLDIDDGTKSLSEFLSDLNANLDDISALSVPVFGDWLGNDKGRATSEMTWGEVQELDDMLKFLVGRGREVKNGLLSDEKTAIADLADEAIKDASKMKGKKLAKHDSLRRRLQDVKESYFAGLRIPLWLFRQMDAWKNISKKGKAGVNETKLWGRLSKALDNYYVATEEMGQKITPHLEHLITSWKNHGADVETSVPVPDCFKPDNRQWTFEHVVMLALNMGNGDNLQRLAAGFTFNGNPMTVKQMQELTGILSASDWKAVQGIWDSINSIYPQIDAVHLKLNHFRMKKVDAQPLTVQTKDGQTVDLAGGYFPIRYDGSLSLLAGMWNEMSDLQSRQEAVLQTPAAKSGFAKQRTATGAKLPVKLSMSVLSEHISDTLRYIHIAQEVRDVDRVTQHKTYQAEALRVLGPELYKMIRPSLKHMIRPDGMTGTRWEKSVQWAMQRSSSFFMAWNLVTVMKNFGGFFQAQARVGLPTMLRGYAAFMSPKHGVKAPKVAFDQIMALSPYMRARYQAYDNDFKRQMMKFKPEKKFFGMSREEISAIGYAGIVAVDSISFLPAWLGSYHNALEMFNGDVDQAVTYADTKIREMQPSGNALDLSHLQRSTGGFSAIGRLFAPFFGFAGNFGNLQRASFAALKAGEIPVHEYLFHTFLIGVAQPLAPLIVLALLRTGEPPDPEEIAREVVSGNMQGLPIIRDMVDYAMSGGYGGGDVVNTPAMELVNIVGKTAHSATDVATNIAEGEPSANDIGKVIFGLAETASYITGVPASRVYAKMMKGYRQIEDGDGTAINLLLPKHKGE